MEEAGSPGSRSALAASNPARPVGREAAGEPARRTVHSPPHTGTLEIVMSTPTRVEVGRLVLVAASALPLSLAFSAGHAYAGPERCDASSSPGAPIDRAEALLKAGHAVQARWAAHRVLMRDAGLSDADRDRAFRVWTDADRKVQGMHPLDVSLAKAELALGEGDVRTAEQHARAVLTSASVDADRSAQARRVLDDAARRRDELAPVVPEALAQAERDFLAGRYAQAKAGLAMVDRSGVTLSVEQAALLAGYQTRIVDLERSRGSAFTDDAMAGVLQPGTVRRREDAPPPTPPPEPAAQPAAQPAEQPVAQPAAQPPQPQPAGDPIQQAMRFEAQSELAEADRAFAESRLNEAQTRYIRLRSEYRAYLTPEQIKHVEDRLTEVRVRMGQQGQPLEELIQESKVRHDQTVVTFNNLVAEAERALDTGDPSRARELTAQARLVLNQGRQWFAEREFQDLANRTDQLMSRAAAREQEIATETVRQRDEDIRRRAQDQAATLRRERDRKINELLDRARAYQSELRYKEALEAVEQLLFLDPINPAGLLLRDVYQAIMIYRENDAMQREKALNYAVNSMDNQRAAIPPKGIVNYPPDWPSISLMRGEAYAYQDTPENRRTLAALEDPSHRFPARFTDNALGDVIGFIKDIAQVDIDVDWTSLEAIGINRDTPVNLTLSNATPKTILDRVMTKLGGGGLGQADWAVRDGIVVVASDDAIRRHTALAIYDVRDLIIEIPDYDDVPTIDLQSVLQSGRGGGGGRSPFRNDQDDRQQRQMTERQERLENIIDIITENIDPEGWVDRGGTTGKIQRLVNQGQLIITNTPKNHREIEGFLSKLRAQRAMQINVETRFLLVNQDFFEQIGFDLDVYINSNNNQLRAARTTAPTVQPSDFFRNGRLQRVVSSPTPGTTTAAPTNDNTAVIHPRPWSIIGFQQDSLGLSSALAPSQGIAADILGGAPALGIAGQFLDDIQVDFLVQATQADRRSVQLTAPRLTFTNGQTSNIFVATQQAFVSDLQPIVGDSAVGFDPTVDVVTEGVTLLVTGTITSDRRYVSMNVDAGVSRIDGFANQAVTAVAGGQLVNSADTQSFIQLPTVTVTRVRTSVTVPDQGSILLGGQRLVTEFDVETGVPVLSKIPILSRFFTNRIESKEEQTLLILIKPTILIQNEEEERQFPGLNEQIRFGG